MLATAIPTENAPTIGDGPTAAAIADLFPADSEYQKHVERNHPSKPVYPTIRQIQELGLKPQDKIWESLGV